MNTTVLENNAEGMSFTRYFDPAKYYEEARQRMVERLYKLRQRKETAPRQVVRQDNQNENF